GHAGFLLDEQGSQGCNGCSSGARRWIRDSGAVRSNKKFGLSSTSELAMRCHWIRCAALLTVLGLPAETYAERRPEGRSEATHVVVGTVEGVYLRERGDTRYYLVVIAIEKVEKGDGFKPGGTFYVGCYLWTPDYYKGKKL